MTSYRFTDDTFRLNLVSEKLKLILKISEERSDHLIQISNNLEIHEGDSTMVQINWGWMVRIISITLFAVSLIIGFDQPQLK